MRERFPEGPEAALRFLSKSEVIAQIGAKHAAKMRKRYTALLKNARLCGCSAPRIETEIAGGEPVYVPGMVKGKGRVRYGEGPARERWTPKPAVDLEDRYDRMDAIEAAACKDPPSETGVLLQWIAIRGAKEETARLRTAMRAEAQTIRK